jgi:hypothetical protein
MRFFALGLCAVALIPASSNAQQAAEHSKGPTVQAAAIGFRVTEVSTDASTKLAAAPILRRHAGQDVALMVVGVGAMIAGAIVGHTAGTIIIIGGAAAALYGLYHYLE